MTTLKPTLRVETLVVLKDGYEVLRLRFHKGVNIVSGHNSSGKTTVLDFLAYGMGAENIPWKQEALLCDEVLVELWLNNKAVTLRRNVSTQKSNPMHIFWGRLDEGVAAPFSNWETYPFKRSSTKISFTQALLLALELPEAQGDGASNLTMHQFLRVLYADQPSLHSPIFRADVYDSSLIRETVGDYLVGAYDDRLYTAQLELREIEKEQSALTAEFRGIVNVFARSQQDFSLEFFNAELAILETERAQLSAKLNELRTSRLTGTSAATESTDTLRGQLNDAQAAVSASRDKLRKLELEMADTKNFINELSQRLNEIGAAAGARTYFGNLNFSFCPCCMHEIAQPSKESTHCSLCQNPIAGTSDSQILRMKNELRIQIAESEALVRESAALAAQIERQLPEQMNRLTWLQQEYANKSTIWLSDQEQAVEETAKSLGIVEQRIAGLMDLRKLAAVIEQLQLRRATLSKRAVELDAIVESATAAQEHRKQSVALEISEILARLLKRDMERQPEFSDPKQVLFSFADNAITVNGASKFSESSTVVLRHLFHVALLSASTRLATMRLPRFMLLDGIEDGGLEVERAHLLQRIIVEECESLEVDYQLIFASSQIDSTLNSPQYVVGREFSEDARSLAIR